MVLRLSKSFSDYQNVTLKIAPRAFFFPFPNHFQFSAPDVCVSIAVKVEAKRFEFANILT
jgi:hypothetical protein